MIPSFSGTEMVSSGCTMLRLKVIASSLELYDSIWPKLQVCHCRSLLKND